MVYFEIKKTMLYDTVKNLLVLYWVENLSKSQPGNVKMSNVNQFKSDNSILYYSLLIATKDKFIMDAY